MATTTSTSTEPPVPVAPLMASGVALSAVYTAIGTFRGSDNDKDWPEYAFVLGTTLVTAVLALLLLRWVLRPGEAGRPGRAALGFALVSVASIAVFWAGVPSVLAASAAVCALEARARQGRWTPAPLAAVVLALAVVVSAAYLAVAG